MSKILYTILIEFVFPFKIRLFFNYNFISLSDLRPDNYCAPVKENAYITVFIEGTDPSWPDDIIEFATPDRKRINKRSLYSL